MNITPIINALIALFSALITVFVIPWIKSKTSNEKLVKMLTLVSIAVKAAEQMYDVTDTTDKKRYVVDYLATKGYALDDSLNNAIESAVLELHNALATH